MVNLLIGSHDLVHPLLIMWKLLILNHSATTKLSFSKNSLASHPLPLDLASGKMIGSADECNDQIETQTQPIESPRQRHETHTTPMMLTEVEIPRPSPANTENSYEDMNLPIALRKGVRACTRHPIANFVCYDKLSNNYRAFYQQSLQ
ncbi:Retrovirus-related Pol polyprotein from transposon RE1 [Senna tora]|uniref:Retrovirus-related Pol polyprotein from transposon RE1 n=1 Tax=Senna tora TaxID=362788 RepID=A0A834SP55_9FABA|nr:Retrovirus-related Pol polyprotein from transposon RE1 [Senna tora]